MKLIVMIAFSALVLGCGEKAKEKSSVVAARAKVKMENATGTALQLVAEDPTYDNPGKFTPTVFKIKVLKIAIAQELDTTKYPASVLYIDSAACTRKDLEDSAEKYSPDVPAKDRIYYKYVGTEDICLADKTDTFLDLTQSSEAVNEALNAQELPVLPGSYKHVMLDLCFQGSDTKPNILFKTAGMSGEKPLTSFRREMGAPRPFRA